MRDTGAKSAAADIVAASSVGRVDVLRMRNRNGPIRPRTGAKMRTDLGWLSLKATKIIAQGKAEGRDLGIWQK